MKNQLTVNFNGQNYIATYNSQSGYYELNLTAPEIGGVYVADIDFTDLFEEDYKDSLAIQILAKEQIEIETNKVFMWIFDYRDFKVKDIVEISDYEINIDEETNSNTLISVLKKTTAKSQDIVAIKKNNKAIYWGIVDNIQNENGKKLYEYTLKYITNIFNQDIALSENLDGTELDVEEGTYTIRSAIDVTKVVDVTNGEKTTGANVQLCNYNGADCQKFEFVEIEQIGIFKYYAIYAKHSGLVLDVENGVAQAGVNVQQAIFNNSDGQKWRIAHSGNGYYEIISKLNDTLELDVLDGVAASGQNIQIAYQNNSLAQRFKLEKLTSEIIKTKGIEDYLKVVIDENFINSNDSFTNRTYIQVNVNSHTPLKTSVSNVQDNIYNLHTWMTNCTQLYNLNYKFYIENKKLMVDIENKELDKELIDVNAQSISEYTEVFTTDVVSKVKVITNTNTYYLYLLTNRTTTTDKENENRAEGKTETVFTENYEDAEQKALDEMKSNSYNHNITFKLLNKFIQLGTSIAIKTKESLIYDTYISAIKITPNSFVEYTCGNIRTGFIEKLSKERRK